MTMLYDYRCKSCGTSWDGIYGMEEFPCAFCGDRDVVRVYHVNVQRSSLRPFTPHYNPTVGAYVSSQHEFNEKLRQHSASATAQTGLDHDFVSADVRDTDVFGTADGINESALQATYDAHPPDSPVRQAITGMIDT